nr:secondary metabolism regulator lae1 [Quercus suber]
MQPEKDRLDAFHHAFYRVALDDRLHEAILPRGKQRILDLGSGTGIWAIEMAAKYPDSEIIAIDLGDAHPQIPGVDYGVDWRTGVDFNNDHWGVPENHFDLIHMGCLCGAVPDWTELFRKAERYLKPGGQLESVEFDWTPRRDESRPIHPDSPVLRYWHLLQHATQSIGKPIAYRADMQTLLVSAGLDIVKHSTVTIATAENLRNFDDDHPYNELARMYQFTMFGHSLLNIDVASVENDEAKLRRYLDMDRSSFDGIQSISMALFTHHLGQSLTSFQQLCQDFQRTVRKRDSPFYHYLFQLSTKRLCSWRIYRSTPPMNRTPSAAQILVQWEPVEPEDASGCARRSIPCDQERISGRPKIDQPRFNLLLCPLAHVRTCSWFESLEGLSWVLKRAHRAARRHIYRSVFAGSIYKGPVDCPYTVRATSLSTKVAYISGPGFRTQTFATSLKPVPLSTPR